MIHRCIELPLVSSDLLRQLGSRCTKFENSAQITVLKFGAISIISAITVRYMILTYDELRP
jgi:hypothetical protein